MNDVIEVPNANLSFLEISDSSLFSNEGGLETGLILSSEALKPDEVVAFFAEVARDLQCTNSSFCLHKNFKLYSGSTRSDINLESVPLSNILVVEGPFLVPGQLPKGKSIVVKEVERSKTQFVLLPSMGDVSVGKAAIDSLFSLDGYNKLDTMNCRSKYDVYQCEPT